MAEKNGAQRQDDLLGVPVAAGAKDVDPKAVSRSVIDRPTATGQGASPVSPMSSFADILLMHVASAADDIEPWGTMRPKLRDRQLRAFYPTEAHFNAALGLMVARNAAFSYQLEGGSRVVRQMQEVLENANDGAGWIDLQMKTSIDIYTTDNGFFWETVRDGDSPDAPLIAINHLDSFRCTHTGDPNAPVIYQDRHGKYHLLKWYQVVTATEMPAPVERFYGRGMCALSRCLQAVQMIRNIQIYMTEKTGGRFEKAIHIVKGITTGQIQDALQGAKIEMDGRGMIRYSTVPIVGIPEPEGDLKIATLELAGLPEGFDQETWQKWYVTVLAMAFLSDYQDFAPMPGGNLGTATQSKVLHIKGMLKGAELYRKMITHVLNRMILPKTVEFSYEINDVDQDKSEADVALVRGQGYVQMKLAGELPAQAIRQMMLNDSVIDQDLFDSLGAMDLEPDDNILKDSDVADVPAPVDQIPDGTNANATGDQLPGQTGQKGRSADAGPFGRAHAHASAELQKRVLKAFRAIRRNVIVRLPLMVRQHGGRRGKSPEPKAKVKQSDSLLGVKVQLSNEEQFWQQQKAVMLDALGSSVPDLIQEGVDQAAKLGIRAPFNLVNMTVQQVAESYSDPWWAALSKTTRDGLRSAIQDNIDSGEPLSALIKDIEPLFGEDRAALIAATETTRLFAEGNSIAYEAAGVEQVEWYTVEDDNVCDDCQEQADLGPQDMDGAEDPPLHPGCRCWNAPVVNDQPVDEIVDPEAVAPSE